MVWDRPRIDPIFWDQAKNLTGMRVIVEDQYGETRRGVLKPADTRLSRNGLGITSDRALVWDGGNCYETYREVDRQIIRLNIDDGRPALPECPGWYTAWDRLAAVHVFRFDGQYWLYVGNMDGSTDPTIPDTLMTPETFAHAHPDFEDGGMRAVTFKDRLASPCGNNPCAWEAPERR